MTLQKGTRTLTLIFSQCYFTYGLVVVSFLSYTFNFSYSFQSCTDTGINSHIGNIYVYNVHIHLSTFNRDNENNKYVNTIFPLYQNQRLQITSVAWGPKKLLWALVPRPISCEAMFDCKTCLLPRWVTVPNSVVRDQMLWV